MATLTVFSTVCPRGSQLIMGKQIAVAVAVAFAIAIPSGLAWLAHGLSLTAVRHVFMV